MVDNLKNIFFNLEIKDRGIFILLSLFPISIILGNLIINLFIFLISISFIINLKENKKFFKDKIFYLLIFFLTSLVLNIFFSIDPLNSAPRVLKLIFITLFILEISRFLTKYKYEIINHVFFFWFLIFFIISIDVIIELIFGKNTLGLSTSLEGRVASFFGDELVVGSYYYGFALFSLSYLIKKNLNIFVLIATILSIIIISFLIGERSSFIRLLISIIIFSSIAINIHYIKKLLLFTVLMGFMTIFLNLNDTYKYRYFDQIKKIYSTNGISYFFKETTYGQHYNVATKIFKEYPIFGVGVKNFRLESFNPKYQPDDTWTGGSTHPHQIHYEFLSETGLFGYTCFLIFLLGSLYLSIKSYLKNRNVYLLSGILFVFCILIPLLPSGSFLTTFFSSIFWINFALMSAFIRLK
tara:strand:- start:425 stop:1657 length:1233 start_codon:yes stop_codon:yes gene_type:complete